MASSFRTDDAILSGSLTNLTDGTSYLIAGAGIDISTGSNGSITITNDGTVGDITSVTADTGLTGGGSSGDVTLSVDSSTVPLLGSLNTFTNSNTFESTLKVSDSNLNFYSDPTTGLTLIGESETTLANSPANANDVKILLSGSAGTKDSSTRGVTLVSGDMVVSGGLYDGLGNTIGGITINNDVDNRILTATGTDNTINGEANLTFDGSTLSVTGSTLINGDLSINQGNRIRFNNPGDNDQYIRSTANQMIIDSDNYLLINSDETVDIQCNNSTSDDVELIRLSVGGQSAFSVKPATIQVNGGYQDTDFLAGGNGESNQGLIYIDAADNSILFGGQNLGYGEFGGAPTTNRPADVKSELGYGDDVKILLSGSTGTKDTSTRGVTLVSGDMVVSGNLYDGEGLGYIKDIEKGSFQATLAANTKQYFPGEDSLVENTYINYYGFVTAPFSGSFDKVILRTYAASAVGGQLSDLGGITASFHRGYNGSDPLNLDTAPDFTEDVKIDLSSHPQSEYLEIIFSGSNFDPGDTYALGVQPDNNWNAGGTLNLNYTIVTSYKVN